MTTDKAPADSAALGYAGGGDAGRGWVEHRSVRHVEVTQSIRNSLSGYLKPKKFRHRFYLTFGFQIICRSQNVEASAKLQGRLKDNQR